MNLNRIMLTIENALLHTDLPNEKRQKFLEELAKEDLKVVEPELKRDHIHVTKVGEICYNERSLRQYHTKEYQLYRLPYVDHEYRNWYLIKIKEPRSVFLFDNQEKLTSNNIKTRLTLGGRNWLFQNYVKNEHYYEVEAVKENVVKKLSETPFFGMCGVLGERISNVGWYRLPKNQKYFHDME